MRILVLAAILGLTACGTTPSMQELEEQAMLTGDWSAVEKRERMMMRREARRGAQCAEGLIGYCQTSFGQDRCQCVPEEMIRQLFAGSY